MPSDETWEPYGHVNSGRMGWRCSFRTSVWVWHPCWQPGPLHAAVPQQLVKAGPWNLRALRSQTVPQPPLWKTLRRPNSALPSAKGSPSDDPRHICSAADATHDICVRIGVGIAVSVVAVIEVPPPVPLEPSSADSWLFVFLAALAMLVTAGC